MSVLVTGGAGFIGSHLVAALLSQGERVVVLDDFSTGKYENLPRLHPKNLRVVEGSVCDPSDLGLAVESDLTVAYHLAAQASVPASFVDPPSTWATNLRGTLNLLDALELTCAPPHLVLASTSAVYGPVEGAVAETAPLNPASPYAESKLAAEYVSRAFVSASCMRFFNVYGPRQRDTGADGAVVAAFLAAAREGRAATINGDGSQMRDFVYVGDVVRALLCVAEERAIGVFNVGRGAAVSIRDLWAHIGSAPPAFAPARQGDAAYSCANINKLTALGWSPQSDLTPTLEAMREASL